MPHIKVKKFNTKLIETLDDTVIFRAIVSNSDDELFAINYKNEEFLLHLKKLDNSYMIKYDKVTRPLKVELLKEAISEIATRLNLTILSSNIQNKNPKASISSKYLKRIKDFENIDFSKEKVSIEVGFGSGKHILYQANKNRDKLYIGIEIHTPSAQQLLNQIDIQQLDNIWVVNYDARLLLEMIPSNILDEIFVHFPVPWDKKPHRRVISRSFLDESSRVLKMDGKLELRTDSDRYFWYSLETFLSYPKILVNIKKNEDLGVISKYEARWRQQEKDIYDVTVISKTLSENRDNIYDFNFKNISFNPKIVDLLPKEAIIEDEFFIHFERTYLIDNNMLLIKCAFGSFDRPEHKYILIATKSRYFSSNPVSTLTNYKAHKKLQEYLNV